MGARRHERRGWVIIRETPRNKGVKVEENDQGVRVGSVWCNSMRVRGGGWVTINSHVVEISIAGGVRKMVRGPTTRRFLFFFLSCALYFNYGEQKPRAAQAIAKKKPLRPLDVSPQAPWKMPSTQVPLV